MTPLHEYFLSHITGGHFVTDAAKNLGVFANTYTSLAAILTQTPNNMLEATRLYQHLGHRLGEFVYTVLHPCNDFESLHINLNQT